MNTGSTHIVTPERFIDDLKVLEMEGVGSAAIPNGLPVSGAASGEYQDYYDKRYFTPDAPPAPAPAPPPASGRIPNGSRTNANNGGGLRPNPPQSSAAPSPTPSAASASSTKEKKKRGLFHF